MSKIQEGSGLSNLEIIASDIDRHFISSPSDIEVFILSINGEGEQNLIE